jgi:hypothetical protein
MNNTMSFIKYLLIGTISVSLLCQSLVFASDDPITSLTVKGNAERLGVLKTFCLLSLCP